MDWAFALPKSKTMVLNSRQILFRTQTFTNFGREWGRYGSPRADIKPGRSYELQEGF